MTDASLKQAREATAGYKQACDAAEQQRAELLEPWIDAANQLQDELQAELENAKSRSAVASTITYFLFVVGSVIALYGQLLDKVLKKK